MSAALQRMRDLAESWEAAHDRRAVFVEAYGTMTARMLEAIEGGEFDDEVWIERLLERFADYYFDAVDGYRSGSGCPSVWYQVLDSAEHEQLHLLQHLFLGINAHINYDLAFALADVLNDWEAMDAEGRHRRRSDHDAVNRVIARTVDEVQTKVIEPEAPILERLDRMLGPVDEWAFAKLIAGWRREVWHEAIALVETSPEGRDRVVDRIERRARRTAGVVHAL
jgi:AcrR family transcriptional regulator